MKKKRLPRRDAIIAALSSIEPRAVHARELADILGVHEGAYLEFLGLLSDLALDGAVRALPGQRYRSLARGAEDIREGRLRAHPRGFGFVCTTGVAADIYVPEGAMGGAMHGDTVRARIVARTWRGIEGCIEEVLQRSNARVQGTLRKRKNSAWLELDDERLRGPVVLVGIVDGKDGDAAVVRITRFPDRDDENPEGELIAALGQPGEPDVETRKVLLRECIEESFTEEAERETAAFADRPSEEDCAGRDDLRAVPFVTIDPVDARDHDDAIWVGPWKDGYEAWVGIADVSAYVREGTTLDQEARARGFSLYLPDRAVPMLPRRLSSTLCSLVEDEDRLCVAAHLIFDARGHLRSSKFCRGVMRSRASLTYEWVAERMKWTPSVGGEAPDAETYETLLNADRLARVLRARRMRRGALDITSAEPEIRLNDEGRPIDVVRRARDAGVRRAYRVVEELMVVTNEAVAAWLLERDLPAIFRVHPPPNEKRLELLAQLCDSLQIPFDVEEASDAQRLGAFLRRVAEHPLAVVIGMLTLRSLAPASYDGVNVGHFGLASRAYAHFTSPIRRYPDLVVHRMMVAALQGGEAGRGRTSDAWQDVAMYCTRRERELVEVEREVSGIYRCVLMRSMIGRTVAGMVTEITNGGVVVSLDEPFVEVLVPEAMMGRETYEKSEDGLHLVGRRSGARISLGSRMTLEVQDVNISRRVTIGRKIQTKEEIEKERNRPSRPRKAPVARRKGTKSKRKFGR